jgi:hypothetical protein
LYCTRNIDGEKLKFVNGSDQGRVEGEAIHTMPLYTAIKQVCSPSDVETIYELIHEKYSLGVADNNL